MPRAALTRIRDLLTKQPSSMASLKVTPNSRFADLPSLAGVTACIMRPDVGDEVLLERGREVVARMEAPVAAR